MSKPNGQDQPALLLYRGSQVSVVVFHKHSAVLHSFQDKHEQPLHAGGFGSGPDAAGVTPAGLAMQGLAGK